MKEQSLGSTFLAGVPMLIAQQLYVMPFNRPRVSEVYRSCDGPDTRGGMGSGLRCKTALASNTKKVNQGSL